MHLRNYMAMVLACLMGAAAAQDVVVSTPNTSLVLRAPADGELKWVYYGEKLDEADLAAVGKAENKLLAAYPAYGLDCPAEAALAVSHADGNMTLQLAVSGVETRQQEEAVLTVVSLKDKTVFYWWKLEHFKNQHLPRVPMAGLNPQSRYRVREFNRIDKQPLAVEGEVFTGAYLMANGLELPDTHQVDRPQRNEYASRVLYLEEVK